jgi:malonyl-CoA O-methyltransferase
MRAEQAAMLEVWPDVEGRRAVDLACGTGRYVQLLKQGGARHVVGLDLSRGMLSRVADASRVQADMTQLPFASDVFDVAVCALAVGHVDLQVWTHEAGRVLDRSGVLLYSDFHPEADRAGLTRSFRDAADRKWVLPHNRYEIAHHEAALAAAGLGLERLHEIRVGREFTETFPGCERFYREWAGLPLVLVIRAYK